MLNKRSKLLIKKLTRKLQESNLEDWQIFALRSGRPALANTHIHKLFVRSSIKNTWWWYFEDDSVARVPANYVRVGYGSGPYGNNIIVGDIRQLDDLLAEPRRFGSAPAGLIAGLELIQARLRG